MKKLEVNVNKGELQGTIFRNGFVEMQCSAFCGCGTLLAHYGASDLERGVHRDKKFDLSVVPAQAFCEKRRIRMPYSMSKKHVQLHTSIDHRLHSKILARRDKHRECTGLPAVCGALAAFMLRPVVVKTTKTL
jgi:hypothetical protein